MSKQYLSHKKNHTVQTASETTTSSATIGNQSIEALMSGQVAPSAQNMGHQVDLPASIREKMETAFGADLSGVRLYESAAVGEASAQAITRGSDIAFAPGKLDFTSTGGQALLGHELSHVISQARGQVSGSGFLNDHALEARADREGALAAAGESVYSGPVTPLSSSSVMSVAGPMQAKKEKKSDPNTPIWEMDPEIIKSNPFNPSGSAEVARKNKEIMDAGSINDAGRTFLKQRGSKLVDDPKFRAFNSKKSWLMSKSLLKKQLSAANNVAHYFPELNEDVFNQLEMNGGVSEGFMSASCPDTDKHYWDNYELNKSTLSWNATVHYGGPSGKLLRAVGNKLLTGLNTNKSDMNTVTVHELGHVLNSFLASSTFDHKNGGSYEDHFENTANQYVLNAIHASAAEDSKEGRRMKAFIEKHQLFDPSQLNTELNAEETEKRNIRIYQKNPILKELAGKEMGEETSLYGATSASEIFAEAFADVFSKGKKATALNRNIVRLARNGLDTRQQKHKDLENAYPSGDADIFTHKTRKKLMNQWKAVGHRGGFSVRSAMRDEAVAKGLGMDPVRANDIADKIAMSGTLRSAYLKNLESDPDLLTVEQLRKIINGLDEDDF